MTTTTYTLSPASTRRLTQAERDRRARAVRKQALLSIIAIIAGYLHSIPGTVVTWLKRQVPRFFASFILLSLSVSAALAAMALTNVAFMFFLRVMGW